MARDAYDISLFVPGMEFDGQTVHEQSLGGSESAGYYMARSLARAGHNVCIFTNCPRPGDYEGVTYRHIQHWPAYVQSAPHDVAIVQRVIEPFERRMTSKLNYWWCHDLALGRVGNSVRSLLWNVDRIMVLSEYMRDQYQEVYDFPPDHDLLYQTRNGIDLDAIPELGTPRRRKRLVHAARPERGLDVLITKIMPRLLAIDPEYTLHVYGYDNPVEHMQAFYQSIYDAAAPLGDAVRFEPCLSKTALYEEYARSGLYVYPTPSPAQPDFAEISCITGMEVQACGLPIVTSNRGALPETIHPDAGVLIGGDPASDEYLDAFVEATIRLTTSDDEWQRASDAGAAHGRTLGWDAVAEDWTEEFGAQFEKQNDDLVRTAYHFYRRSDIIAAKTALSRVDKDAPGAEAIRDKISHEYNFIKNKVAFEHHYKKNGEDTDARLETIPVDAHDFTQTNESRFHSIVDALKMVPSAQRILEFGCGHGWLSIYCHNQVGRDWTGVDVDPGAIKWAEKLSRAHATRLPTTEASGLRYVTGDEDVDLSEYAPFDCLIISEVLEHCVNPVDVVRKMERWLAPGALVIVTVPWGPSEYATPNWEHFRNHVWEFDTHDLRDVFGKKPRLSIGSIRERMCEVTGESVGYHFVTYFHDPEREIGEIDMERKLRLQRPRLTMSVSCIAGPNAEETLLWMLRSVRWIADEIVIGDTGMSELALDMCRTHGARIVPAPNPLEHGFDTARNASLDACTMDLVLWIDTDEKLVDAHNITKYARKSWWNGFSVNQHHFTVDGAGFKPDLPVRLFRRAPYNGRVMRFWGRLHEHPELEINEGPGPVLIVPDVHVAHVGYLSETGRRKRFARNLPLLEMDMRDYPHRKLQKHFIMRDRMLVNMYELQQNGGQLTPEIRARAQSVVDLYREHFLGKPGYVNADSLQYYSQALQQLGEGFDVGFSIGVQRDGQGDQLNGSHEIVARFASMEEVQKEVSWRLEDKFQSVGATSKMW